jgi:hypothetical protein
MTWKNDGKMNRPLVVFKSYPVTWPTWLPDATGTLDAVRWAAAGILGGHTIFHLKAEGIWGWVKSDPKNGFINMLQCQNKDELGTLVDVVNLEKDPQLFRGSYNFDIFRL